MSEKFSNEERDELRAKIRKLEECLSSAQTRLAQTIYQYEERLKYPGPIPSECKLVAVHTGDGWHIGVQKGDLPVADLAWPDAWPRTVTTSQLESFGFECA